MIHVRTAGYGESIMGTYIIAYEGLINGMGSAISFTQSYHHPFAWRELYIIALFYITTCCIKATVCSIRYF